MFKILLPAIICILSALSCAESTRIAPEMVGELDQKVADDPRDQSPQTNDMTSDMMSNAMPDVAPSPADAELDQQVGMQDMSRQDMSRQDMSSERDINPPDEDLDGYPVDVDCDDRDPLINPEAPERCNSIDDDCEVVFVM